MDLLDILYKCVAVPVAYVLWAMWHKIAKLEKDQAVTQVMVDNIRDDIKEIKHGIDTLVSRQMK